VINNIAVLITCHNRKLKTLACLKALYSQDNLGFNFKIEVFLVDDRSFDGTSDAVMSQFPQVNIIKGDGNLYWNRGMILAWKTAAVAKDFEYYLWLNDDTFLFRNAIEVLLRQQFPFSIVSGATKSALTGNLTYGGWNKKSKKKLVSTNGSFQNVDYCNGNCVLIPKKVFKKIGSLDNTFHHALGDFDYSLRAQKMGIEVKVAPEIVAYCESHISVPEWRSTSLSISQRFKKLYHPLSGCNPKEFFVFDWRHNGFILALFHFFTINLRALFPKLYDRVTLYNS
jgi:GT2 family glycosyltransferase